MPENLRRGVAPVQRQSAHASGPIAWDYLLAGLPRGRTIAVMLRPIKAGDIGAMRTRLAIILISRCEFLRDAVGRLKPTASPQFCFLAALLAERFERRARGDESLITKRIPVNYRPSADRGFPPDRIEGLVEPLLGGLSSKSMQFAQERPGGIELRGGCEGFKVAAAANPMLERAHVVVAIICPNRPAY